MGAGARENDRGGAAVEKAGGGREGEELHLGVICW